MANKMGKVYEIGDNIGFRLTEKAGVTEELMEYINSIEGGLGKELIKALKYWNKTNDGQYDPIREDIERESKLMERTKGHHGENRPKHYKKRSKVKTMKTKEKKDGQHTQNTKNIEKTKHIQKSVEEEVFGDEKRTINIYNAMGSMRRR